MYTREDPEFVGQDTEDLIPEDEEISSEDLGCSCFYCMYGDDHETDWTEYHDPDDDGRDGIAAD